MDCEKIGAACSLITFIHVLFFGGSNEVGLLFNSWVFQHHEKAIKIHGDLLL